MSRSFGDTPSTLRPPISIVPSLGLSRPAMMLSSVDFPQPDGPSRTMNSPLSMVEVDALEHVHGAEPLVQPIDAQRRHAVSYFIAPAVSPRMKYWPPKK